MKRSYGIALLISLAVAGWVFSGQLGRSQSNASLKKDDANSTDTPVMTVRGQVLHAREYASDIILRGRTEALRSVEIKAQTDGRVVELPVEKGTRVGAGEIICRLATDERAARLAQARALVRQRQLEYDAATELAAKGYRAETQAAAAKAALDAATAQVTQMKVELSHTEIRAPFDGVLEERPVEIGDYLQKGKICGKVVDDDPFLVVGEVSERNVGVLTIGDTGKVRLLDGRLLPGKVRFIATTANPQTRTFRVELEVANTSRDIRDGMTSEIRIPAGRTMAHKISPALLVLDDKGRLGVRIVDDNDIVRFVAVKVVGDAPDGTWVAGLPETVRLITVGHEFVADGQTVRLALEGGSAER